MTWAIINPSGTILLPIHRLRVQAIREACAVFDRACYDAAVEKAKHGEVWPFLDTAPLTADESRYWAVMRRRGYSACWVRVEP